jgi:hypothetical protein
MEQRFLLSGNQMQRAAVDPRNDQGAFTGQSSVNVGAVAAAGPGANSQPRSTRILRLHGQQVTSHLERITSPCSREQLVSRAARTIAGSPEHSDITAACHAPAGACGA